MHLSPQFMGGVGAVLVTVASGAVLGTVPEMRQLGLSDMLPEASGPSFARDYKQERPPQDQYAIVTPEGRFEVEELSERGLYRARYADYPAYVEPVEYEPVALDAAYPVEEQVVVPAIEPSEEPPAETAPAFASSGPRIINVAEELAARR